MAIKYVPYFPNTLEGQAVLDNFVRTKRVLRYRDNNQVIEPAALSIATSASTAFRRQETACWPTKPSSKS